VSTDDDVFYAAEEIRNQAIHLNVAAQNWTKAWQNIRAAELPADALGKIGEEAGYAQQFNSYAEQVVQKLWSGSQSLSSGVDGLHKVANTYEHNEFRSTQSVESVRPDIGL
jgi:hypothetical protein